MAWVTDGSSDLVEWTFRVGAVRVVRTALLLRGRRLALLADQVEGPVPVAAMRISLPEGVAAQPIVGCRAFALSLCRERISAHVLPIGLPQLPFATDRGEFAVTDRELVLRRKQEGRRCWLPLLASWDAARARRASSWRILTVAERSKVCPPEVAFAARVTWARGETFVIYRSLARPALRSFLGHQTQARFLVGIFSKEGTVEPIVTLDE
jgi:hypothetical protein